MLVSRETYSERLQSENLSHWYIVNSTNSRETYEVIVNPLITKSKSRVLVSLFIRYSLRRQSSWSQDTFPSDVTKILGQCASSLARDTCSMSVVSPSFVSNRFVSRLQVVSTTLPRSDGKILACRENNGNGGRFSLTGRRSEGSWNRVAMQNQSECWNAARTLIVINERSLVLCPGDVFRDNVADNWSEPWPSARFNLQHTPRRISGSNWEKGENRRRRVGERVVDEFL